MSELIKWKELHPWQRNQLIAGKIFGVTNFLCTGKLTYDGNNAMYRHHYYVCQECSVRLTVTDDYRDACGVPKEHARFTPAYSESLDAAWLIVEHITKPPSTRDAAERAANTRFGLWWNGAELWSCSAKEVAECVCVAALGSLGYVVVT